MSIKRTIITAIVGLTLVAVVAPVPASATTIAELQAMIAQLTAQLAQLSGTSTTTTTTGTGACAGVTFSRNMTVGATGSDVKCLQVLLNGNGFTVATTGAGSPGAETSYFGSRTLVAVKAFQVAKGFVPANQVGPQTRAALNALLGTVGGTTTTLPQGCTSTSGFSPITGASCATGAVVVNPTAGGLSVAVAYDTPAAATIAANANGNFTKVTFTAGSGDVSISKIYITRGGLSGNADIANIKVVDAVTGVYYGNVGSINSDNRAMISFTQNLVIPAGTSRSFFFRAGFPTNATAGKTATLGIVSASDISSNATSVSGNFPAVGNAMTVVSLTIGSLILSEDGTTVDSKPNVGDKGVVLNNFKLAAGSTEDITVDTITMLKSGTINNNYLANLTLYDVSKGAVVGSVVPSLTAEGKAVWSNLGIVISKGNTERFQVRADITDGPGLTANADVVDGSDVLVVARGNNYGFFITPTDSWTGGFSSNHGTGTNNQSVNGGALTISRSTKSPATGKTAAGDNVPLAAFDFYVVGEQVRVSKLVLTATFGTMTYDQLTAVKLYDENGNIVAGPNDTVETANTITFTDVFTVPVGTHTFYVKGKIASTVSTGDTVSLAIAAGGTTDLTVTGMTSNSTITAGGTPAGNTQTIAAGALDLATNTAAVHSVAKGTKAFLYGTASLSAANSGEDVLVTSLSIADAVVADAAVTDLQNMTLWADLTAENSARGDVYETQISNPVNESAATQAFTLTRSVTVPKGSFVKVALIADLSTAAATTSTPTHTITFTTTTTVASGATTGTSITTTSTPAGLSASGSGRAMTNASTGALTVSLDSSSPQATDIILGGQEVTLAVFKLSETNNVENLNVDDITFSVTNGDLVDTFRFYNGGTLLGEVSGSKAPKLVLGSGQLTVPANSNVKVTVKGLILPVDGSTVTNGASVTPNIYAAVNATGLSSGSPVTSTEMVTGTAMTIEKARPYFAVSTSPASPSGVLYPSANTQLAIFDVSNTNGGDDVTFSTAASSKLLLNISKSMNTSVSTARTYTLTDGAGTTYATGVDGAACTGNITDITSTSVCFATWTNSLVIAPNTTKKLYVIGDTSGFSAQYDSIQLSLQATAANCTYSVGTATATQAMGAIVFKGNIYGGSLQHP